MLQRAVGPQVARAALLFGMSFDAESAVRYGLALSVADDPVAAALELAAGPASAPREVVLATKASMRATASPGHLTASSTNSRCAPSWGRRCPRSSRRSSPTGWPRHVASRPYPRGPLAASAGPLTRNPGSTRRAVTMNATATNGASPP